jgi:hypothetical protein
MVLGILLTGGTPQVEAASATGGTVTNYTDAGGTNWTAHIFTSSGVFTNYSLSSVEVLVVGGGGGGGCAIGGGGGGGGVVAISSAALTSGTYTVTVGGGGAGGSGVYSSGGDGGNGTNSSAFGAIAAGGGGGGHFDGSTGTVGKIGGSGGGAGANSTSSGSGASGGTTNGSASSLGGYAGKIYECAGGSVTTPRNGVTDTAARGGGGAGTNATSGVAAGPGGAGGAGITNAILGANYYWGGGGGGGAFNSQNGGNGGTGGGGGGASRGSTGGGYGTGGLTNGTGGGAGNGAQGGNGGANTGGGGGGGTWLDAGTSFTGGGNGGSGIVIVRYPTSGSSTLLDIRNAPVTAVTTTGATFNGWLVSTGGSPTTVYVLWGTNNGAVSGVWANTNWWNPGDWTNGSYPSTNVSLTMDQNYYYTFGASNTTTNVTAASPQYLITGALSVQASDPTGRVSVSDTAAFTVTRPATCTNAALIVNYTLGGTATNVTDYTIAPVSGAVVIAQGQTNGTITVTPVFKRDAAKTVILTLTNGPYAIGTANSATATLAAVTSMDLTWTGSANGNWDTSSGNWTAGSLYTDGDNARFTDSSAVNAITLSGTVAPGSTTFSNSTARTYVLTGAGTLSAGSFTKDANGRADIGSITVAPPTLSFAGGTIVNGGRLNYLVTVAGGNYSFGSGAITLNNAEFGFSNRDTTYGAGVSLSNNLVVGATGGALLTGTTQGRFSPILGGTIDLQGDFTWKLHTRPDGTPMPAEGAVNPVVLNTITLSGSGVTRKFECQGNSYFDRNLGTESVWIRRAITGPVNTLTLNGTDSPSNPADMPWVILDARASITTPITDAGGSCSLNVANLTVQDRVAVMANADADDFFSTLRGNGGKVTIANGGNLNLFRGTFRTADFVFNSNSTLTFESRSLNGFAGVKLLGDLSVSSTAGDLANLNWPGNDSTAYRQFRNAGDTADGTVTIGNGGALNVRARMTSSNPIEYQGNLKFLGGATINGTVANPTGSASGATDISQIRQRSATDTFALGDGNINTLETITIKGLHPVANSTGAFIIGTGQSAGQFVDDNNVILRYESTGATASKSFNVAWNTTTDLGSGGAVMKLINVPLRAGSAGTIFAPEVVASTTTIKAVGPTNGNVFVTAKPATLVTAGTIGFYNQSTSANGQVGNLGPIAINAGGALQVQAAGQILAASITASSGGSLSISNAAGLMTATNITVNGGTLSGIGTYATLDMVFTNGATFNVVLTGAVTNNCGLLAVTNTLAFAAGTPLTVDTNAYVPVPGQYWYIAAATTISGLPTPPADYTVVAEGGTRLKLTKLSGGTAPDISNLAPTNVLATSATLCGYLNSTGTAATTVSVYWGPTDGGTTAGAWGNTNTFPSPSAPGLFATNVTPLVANAQYFYRYFASNIGGGTWPTQSEYFITSDVWVNGTLNAAESGPVTGLLTVSRSPLLTNGNLIVNYALGGTASNGIDYTSLPGAVTIPAGASNATISVIPFNDALAEGTETVTVMVVAGRYTVGSPASASIDVLDYPAQSLTWSGGVNGNWDSATANWTGGLGVFAYGDQVTFNDTSTRTNVSVVGTVTPATMLVTNATRLYTFSSGAISGGGTLRKAGAGDAIVDSTTALTGYSGPCTVTGGRLLRQQGSGDGSFGSSAVTLDGGAVGVKHTGGFGTTVSNSNPITVTASAGSGITALYLDGNISVYNGGIALNGGSTLNLDASGAAGNAYSLILGAMTLGGSATIKRNYDDTFLLGGTDGRRAVYLNGAISGVGQTLTLDGINMRMQSTGSATVSNLVVMQELWVENRSGAAFVTLGAGGTVRVASNGLLALQSTTLDAAKLVLDDGATLQHMSGNGSSSPTIQNALSVDSNRTVWLGVQAFNDTMAFPGGVTFNAGSRLVVGPGNRSRTDGARAVSFSGTARFLGGSTIEANILQANGTDLRNTGTLVFGDTNAGTAETVTIKGQGTGVLAFAASSVADIGGLTLRYAAATNAAPFKVGWGATGWNNENGGVGALTAAFLGGSAATEFAPQVGTGDNGKIIAIGRTNNATVFTVTNLTTVTTAGTVEFRNSAVSGSDTWLPAGLGGVVITNGATLAFSTNGTVVASNVTFHAGTTLAVTPVGTASNAVGYLRAADTLSFATGTTLVVTNPLGFRPAQRFWYVAEATTISGQPSAPGFIIEIEAGTPQRLKVSPDLTKTVFTFR